MQEDYKIRVGIKTSGSPLIKPLGKSWFLKNMLIGDGFHWQTEIEAILPGEIEKYRDVSKDEKYSDCDRNISLVNTLPLETYLECVVGSEMNPASPGEFLKAHAIISRSWALGKILVAHRQDSTGKEATAEKLVGWDDTAVHKGFDVCSDDHCQRYQGMQPISDAALEAIKATEHEVLIDSHGQPADTRFSKCCGGITELFSTCWQPVDFHYLESFEDPWCNLEGLAPLQRRALLSNILKDYDLETDGYGFRWHAEVTKEDIKNNLLKNFGRSVGEIRGLEVMHRGPSGRIDLLRIKGSEGILDLGKELWIRRLLSPSHLYSSAFEIEDKGDSLMLSGRGWGHGVGLCQIGAANMALHGHTCREILQFYYPGCKIASLKDIKVKVKSL